MRTQAKAGPKNPEKKEEEEGVSATSQDKNPGGSEGGSPGDRSVFLEIIFGDRIRSPKKATVIAWTIHPEGLRGQLLGGDRRKLVLEASEILHAHAHASARRTIKVDREILEIQGFSQRISAMMKLHAARRLDRKRRQEAVVQKRPLDFDDYEVLGRDRSKEG